jgi:hypothetical protein
MKNYNNQCLVLSDDDLTLFVNSLGAGIFLLIAAYHYVAVNHSSSIKAHSE